jgi:pyridoxal phosphate enzyme (YggS family)
MSSKSGFTDMQDSITQKLTSIRSRMDAAAVRSGRAPRDVRLVAVGKTKPASAIREAVSAGVDIIGENYIQEARDKFNALSDLDIQWHFIGHLQSNKAKYAVRMFDLIHSVDSYKLAAELNKQARTIGKLQNILVQVNISGETTKWGAAESEAMDLIAKIGTLENLKIKGLMTMPPFFDAPEQARPYFAALHRLAARIQSEGCRTVCMNELSMGMTGDFEVAIEEGATLVRIGTAIFGARQ